MLIDENNSRNISIEILSKDRIGLVHDITSAISALDAQVIHYHAKVFTDNKSRKMSECSVSVSIDEQGCRALLGRLRKIKGVVRVSPVYAENQSGSNNFTY